MKSKRKLIIFFISITLFILLILLFPTWTPKIKGNSIAILESIEINGTELEVMIKVLIETIQLSFSYMVDRGALKFLMLESIKIYLKSILLLFIMTKEEVENHISSLRIILISPQINMLRIYWL